MMSTRGRLTRWLVPWLAVLAAATLAVACGPRTGGQASGPTVKEIATYTGGDRQPKLEAGARQEATLMWYTSLGLQPNAEPLARAFEAKYPFIKVEIYRSDGAGLILKITEEAKAGKTAADVVETTLNTLKPIKEENLLTEYYIPNANAYPRDAKEMGSGSNIVWAVDREHYISFGYNKTLVDPSALPKDWDGLLAPGLKGKMQIVGTGTGMDYVGSVLTNKSADFMKRLAQQEIKTQVISGTAMLDLIAKGEVPASPTIFQAEVKAQQAKGAPVDWIALEPVMTNAGALAFMAGAPHPNAAALFAEWLLGPEGQGAYKGMGFGSAGSEPGFRRWYPGAGTTATQYEALFDAWKKVFDESFVRAG